MYDTNMKYKWDNANVRAYEINEALKQAHEQELERVRNIGRMLKKRGVDIEIISETTNLSIEEIEKL